MTKVLFVIQSLAGGGAERAVLNILRHIDRSVFEPHLALFEKRGVHLGSLPEDVPVIDMHKGGRLSFLRLVFAMAYRVFPQVRPDVVISFIEYPNFATLVARLCSVVRPPVLVSERGYTAKFQSRQNLRWLRRQIVKLVYPSAVQVLAVSDGLAAHLVEAFGLPGRKVHAIHNGIDVADIRRRAETPVDEVDVFRSGEPVFVACGRFVPEKNYPMLLRAFRNVLDHYVSRLVILGEGKLQSDCEVLARDLGLAEHVVFLGFQENPYKFMARAYALILSSLHEGFPNVLVEAMACGTPVISTRCPSGPDEMITDGENGLLVPVDDIEAMTEAMKRLIEDNALHESLSEAGLRRAQDFTVEKMVKSYESVLLEAVDTRRK